MEHTNGVHLDDGQVVKKKRKPRSKANAKRQEQEASQISQEPVKCDQIGRLGSSVQKEAVMYFVKPWVPKKELTLVAGEPGTGKSSFAAWLAGQAWATAILPGYEERVASATLPRMEANGVDLQRVLLLDDKAYRLPCDKSRIAEAMKAMGADLLIIDPIDSYMEDGKSENCGPDVREMLEACFWIAEQAEAAVVGIRHPGKDVKNIMPGSRAWRAVPRSVVHLVFDHSFPPKRFIVHDKDQHGNNAPPQQYALEGKAGGPARFVLGSKAADAQVSLSRRVSDPSDRADVRMAGRILRRLMTRETEALVEDFKGECDRNGVSVTARRLAGMLLGLDPKPKEQGGKWFLFRTTKDWPGWTDELPK